MVRSRGEALVQGTGVIWQNDEPFLKGRCVGGHGADEWASSYWCAKEMR
jgi:hypothetical protein